MTDKVKYIISFINSRTANIDYRTFHRCTLDEAIAKFKDRNLGRIKKVEQVTTRDVTNYISFEEEEE